MNVLQKIDGETVVLDRTMPLAWEPLAALIDVIQSPAADRRFRGGGFCRLMPSVPIDNG